MTLMAVTRQKVGELLRDNSIQLDYLFSQHILMSTLSLGGGGLVKGEPNLQPEVPCELDESEFCAGITCKTNTVDILQKTLLAALKYSRPSRNNFSEHRIFSQVTKPTIILTKMEQKFTYFHSQTRAFELKFVPAELRHSSVLIG